MLIDRIARIRAEAFEAHAVLIRQLEIPNRCVQLIAMQEVIGAGQRVRGRIDAGECGLLDETECEADEGVPENITEIITRDAGGNVAGHAGGRAGGLVAGPGVRCGARLPESVTGSPALPGATAEAAEDAA